MPKPRIDLSRRVCAVVSSLVFFGQLATPAHGQDCNGNGVDDAADLAGPIARGYWRFEEPTGPYLDSGPNGLVGVATATDASPAVPVLRVPRTTADNFLSCDLGGVGSMVVQDSQGHLRFAGSSFTIEAWVRLDTLASTSSPTQRQYLVQKKALGVADAGFDYAILVQRGAAYTGLVGDFGKNGEFTGRELMALFGTGSGVWAVTSHLQITDTNWHHITVTHDAVARKVRFGLDGVFETLDAPGPSHFASTGPLLVGAHTNASGAYNQFLRGAVDELRITAGVIDPKQLLRSYAMADCNRNGVLDECDIASGLVQDCDGDGQLDLCQVFDDDCNKNGIPDQCDPDCNANGLPDECDLATGTSVDCQNDGVPDECQLQRVRELKYDNGWARIAWRADEPYMAWLNRFNVVDGAQFVDGIEVLWGIMPIGTQVEVFVWSDPNGDGNPSDATVLWSGTATVAQTDTLSLIEVPAVDVGDSGASFFVGFIMEATTEMFPAALDIDGVPVPDRSWGVGSFSPIDPNNLPANAVEYGTINNLLFGNTWVLRARTRGLGSDCNANGVPDACDITSGLVADADRNGIPDVCEDCNANGIVDGFEIADGSSADQNADGVPDSCQLASNDCDANGIPDDVTLPNADCNGNGILDTCDIVSGFVFDINANGIPDDCEDCNGNGTVDPVDIKLGLSVDCNEDGIPDECQFGAPADPVRYAYDDGVQEANINFVGAVLEFAWMNRFTVVEGGEVISAVEVVWGDTYPDLPAEVVLWSDPNGDGNPADARVLVTVDTRSMKIDFPSDNLNVVQIPPTRIGPAGTSFFVGVHFDDIWGSGKPVAIDVDEPHSRQGWIAYALTGTMDIDNLAGGWIMHWPHHDLLVRAIGSDGRLVNDCNVNAVLDACDVASGQRGDLNGNGVPDDCELLGDVNGDGRVDAADLSLLLATWGGGGAADIDGDGSVGAEDLSLLLAAWTN